MKLTEEQVQQAKYNDVYDETGEILLYKHISSKLLDFDKEKSSSEIWVVIKDVKTGKKYGACLLDSVWCGEAEYNAKEEWEEIIPKQRKPVEKKSWDEIADLFPGDGDSGIGNFVGWLKENYKVPVKK